MKRVCIFCASSKHIATQYIVSAKVLTRMFVAANWAINYGGGSVGLMGAVADEALRLNGKITGVIPQFMVDVEWQHPDVKDMILVKTMSERKSRLVADVDAVVALPGSTGTLDELFEVVSNKKLGLFTKPIVVLNTDGFYNDVRKQLEYMVDEHFMNYNHLQVLRFVDNPQDVLETIESMGETNSAAALAAAATR